MNDASKWRWAIARKVAPYIAANPKVAAVILGGSTSRGYADSFSDIEIGVFWHAPPTEQDRTAYIEQVGGQLWQLDPFAADETTWVEEWGLQGLKIDVRNLTVNDTERIVNLVLNEADTNQFRQVLASTLQYCIPLYNSPRILDWKERLATYPLPVGQAMVQQNINQGNWFWWYSMLVARGDIPAAYGSMSFAANLLLNVLLGLNKIYYPGEKWLDRTTAQFQLAPQNFNARLKACFQIEPAQAAFDFRDLVLEVYDLVDTYMPEVDTATARRDFLYWRQQFSQAPILLAPEDFVE